ncbi:leishmanolysin-related zinc metalloendopeptidase [Algoriphagus algorifonticola]|uniref:leishmanolysin-related zinc metalloendopeptidase n=1 Tax=Algoriphagus algorifonticola TaxID=2593007 RepID=UPI0011A74806|nr:leishmanolysin-related zinc metalloendopeptidase [Algoriphagus algorifonticola]
MENINQNFKRTEKVWRKSLYFGLVASVLTFTSCSDLSTENPQVDFQAEQNKTLTLFQPTEFLTFNAQQLDGTINARATDAAGVDRGRFNLTLRYLTPVTERQRAVFESAAARWERIIIKDVPSITANGFEIPSSFNGFPPVLADGETLDDLIIEVAIAPIDGRGGILGQAGPRFYRTADFLPLSGVMFFDVADLDFLESLNLFEDVIVHEMGHVLGVGTAWNNFGRALRVGTNTPDVYFAGESANKHWNAEGGLGFLPIENTGGQGTRNSHWRESILRNELMTGFLNLGSNPLSRITAGSLRDLGYGVGIVGERYELQRGAEGIDASHNDSDQAGINIAEMEVLLEPIGAVTFSNEN